VGVRLSRAALQLRANQLVRELHSSEETASSFRILEERRNKFTALTASSSQMPAAAKTGNRTGLQSYFNATSGTSDDPAGDDDEEVKLVPPPAQAAPNATLGTSDDPAGDDDDEVEVVPPPVQSSPNATSGTSEYPVGDDNKKVKVIPLPAQPSAAECIEIPDSPGSKEKRKSDDECEESSPEKKLRVA